MTKSREGLNRTADPYLTEVMKTRKPFIKDIYDSDVEGKTAMTFSAPGFAGSTGESTSSA